MAIMLMPYSRRISSSRMLLFSILPFTDGIDFTRPIFNILDEACGIQVSSTITHLRAAMGDPAVRHALALQRDQALLELSETCYSRLCRPVLRCRTFYTDFFDFALVRKLV